MSINFVNAQNTRVLAELEQSSTTIHPIIHIKWYSDDLIYAEGVNIFRRETGQASWQKLNNQLIRKKTSMAPAQLANDPDVSDLVEIANAATVEQITGSMFIVDFLAKSFHNQDFAEYLGIYYKDTNVKSGVSYEYKINKIKNGAEVLLGVSNEIIAEAYQPNAKIDPLIVYQKLQSLNLNWDHDEDRFYAVNIYRTSSVDDQTLKLNNNPLMLSQNPDSVGRMAFPDPKFTDIRDLEEGVQYTYQVAGVGFFGLETALSDPFEITLEDVTPPSAPKNLSAKADSMKVHLNWKNVETADLKGVNIYRSMHSEGPFEIVNGSVLSLGQEEYSDSLTIPGPYYYYVAATDYSDNEAHSNLMFAEVQDVIPPATPQDILLSVDTGRVSLSWKRNEEPDLAGYYIYRTVNRHKKKNYVLLNAIPVKENSFEDEFPKNVKNEIFYHVIAVDTSYNRSPPSKFVSGRMPDILAPEKPFIKEVTYEGEQILIEWISNVDTDLNGYHIYRADTTKNFQRLNINLLSGSANRYTDRDNQANKDYFYYLEALDSVGNVSLPSKEKYARRVAKNNDEISENIELKFKHFKRRKRARLTWTEVRQDIQGYVVYRGDDENKLKPITGLIDELSYMDRDLSRLSEGEYYYQVRGYQKGKMHYSAKISWQKKKTRNNKNK